MAEWWNVTRKNWQRAKLPVLMKCEKGKELAKLFNQVDQPFSSQHKKKHMKRILKHNFFLFFCLFGDMYFCVLGDMYFCLLRDMYCSACKSISIITRLQSLWPCQQNINERTEYQQNINRISTEYQQNVNRISMRGQLLSRNTHITIQHKKLYVIVSKFQNENALSWVRCIRWKCCGGREAIKVLAAACHRIREQSAPHPLSFSLFFFSLFLLTLSLSLFFVFCFFTLHSTLNRGKTLPEAQWTQALPL